MFKFGTFSDLTEASPRGTNSCATSEETPLPPMEVEGPCSQKPKTDLYPEPHKATLIPTVL